MSGLQAGHVHTHLEATVSHSEENCTTYLDDVAVYPSTSGEAPAVLLNVTVDDTDGWYHVMNIPCGAVLFLLANHPWNFEMSNFTFSLNICNFSATIMIECLKNVKTRWIIKILLCYFLEIDLLVNMLIFCIYYCLCRTVFVDDIVRIKAKFQVTPRLSIIPQTWFSSYFPHRGAEFIVDWKQNLSYMRLSLPNYLTLWRLWKICMELVHLKTFVN